MFSFLESSNMESYFFRPCLAPSLVGCLIFSCISSPPHPPIHPCLAQPSFLAFMQTGFPSCLSPQETYTPWYFQFLLASVSFKTQNLFQIWLWSYKHVVCIPFCKRSVWCTSCKNFLIRSSFRFHLFSAHT